MKIYDTNKKYKRDIMSLGCSPLIAGYFDTIFKTEGKYQSKTTLNIKKEKKQAIG